MRIARALAALFVTLLTVNATLQAQPPERPRGFLGVRLDPEQAENKAVVSEVTPDSPAAKAGLKPGDIITKVNDKSVTGVDSFIQTVAEHKPGDKVTLHVTRGGKAETLSATVGDRPRTAREPFPVQPRFEGIERSQRGGAYLGVQMQELTPALKDRLKIDADKGVVITEVEPDSPATKAGLKADDVITGVGDKVVSNPEELRRLVQETGAGKELVLRIMRGKEKLDVKATLVQGPRFRSIVPDGFGRRNIEPFLPLTEGSQKVQELEKKVQELEKRIQELEKKVEKK